MRGKTKGNLAMGSSKFFSGINENALKFLVPTWLSPISGVMTRLCFGAIAFWTVGIFTRKKSVKATARERALLFLIGAVFMFGYMGGLLAGLAYTTPISSSIFISLQPVVVFIITAIFYHEKVTSMKVVGILVGVGGALICIMTQKNSAVATNAMLGNLFCAFSTLTYSIYLVLTGRFLKKLDNITVSKWTFLGGAFSSAIAVAIAGWHAPVFTHTLLSMPWAALLFVLIFPTFVSYFLLDIGLRYLNTTVVALYANVILIVATVASYILGQDIFSWWQMLSIALMIASVYFVEVAESKGSKGAKATTTTTTTTTTTAPKSTPSESDDKTGAVVGNVDNG